MLVMIIVIALVAYAASKYFPPVKRHMELKKVVEDYMWANGTGGERPILQKLPPKVSEVKEDLGRDDIVVKKVGNKYITSIDYTETVVLIPDKLEHELEFHVEGFSKPLNK